MTKLINSLLCIFVVCVVAACAYNREYAVTETKGTNGVVTINRARSTTLALGDAKATIEKTKASAGKTASVGVNGIGEEATTAGLATNLAAATSLINALKGP